MITKQELENIYYSNNSSVIDILNKLAQESKQSTTYKECIDEEKYKNIINMLLKNENMVRNIVEYAIDHCEEFGIEQEYRVKIIERHVGYVVVSAANAEDAVKKAYDAITDTELKVKYLETEDISQDDVEQV